MYNGVKETWCTVPLHSPTVAGAGGASGEIKPVFINFKLDRVHYELITSLYVAGFNNEIERLTCILFSVVSSWMDLSQFTKCSDL